jgi:pentose-5-phosphate-3-epimerase
MKLYIWNKTKFSKAKMDSGMERKIKLLREMLNDKNPAALIQGDGGMTCETLPIAYRAIARAIVAGSAVFNHPHGITGGIQALRGVLF